VAPIKFRQVRNACPRCQRKRVATWVLFARQIQEALHPPCFIRLDGLPLTLHLEPDLLCTDVDYKGVVYGTQLAIFFMRKNATPGGIIVATASVAAIVPHETYPEYDGAKAAVVNFVRGTARVLKNVSFSIRISKVLGVTEVDRKKTSRSTQCVQALFTLRSFRRKWSTQFLQNA
jgi:hypothetical protein